MYIYPALRKLFSGFNVCSPQDGQACLIESLKIVTPKGKIFMYKNLCIVTHRFNLK